jgi:hypothetical protein
MLDVFRTDAFSTVSLTAAINKVPHRPGRIGKLGLFRSKGITTTTVVVEEKDGQLTLITTSPRGGPGSQLVRDARRARSFVVPHLERDAKVQADEVQGVRAFGSEDATQAVQTLINERLETLRAMHEVTHEYLRVGALKGLILDGDGSTIYNLFTEFGVTQQSVEIDFASASMDFRMECVQAKRLVENELGAEPISGFRCFCGDDFYDNMLEHDSVKESLKYQESRQLREDLRGGFEYGGIVFENYRGTVNGTKFFADDEAYVVPEGTNIFQMSYAPADFIETVNTMGLPLYAKMVEDKDLNRWQRIHTQSNPLPLCLRPRGVVKLYLAS